MHVHNCTQAYTMSCTISTQLYYGNLSGTVTYISLYIYNYVHTGDIELQQSATEECNPPKRQNGSVSDSCNWSRSAEAVTEEEDHPNSCSVSFTVPAERTNTRGR